jgi:formate/nitrite transporter
MTSEIRIDALLPAEMARRVEAIGIKKSEAKFIPMFVLAILAGAFISLGGMFSTIAVSGSMAIKASQAGELAFTATLPYGIIRVLAGLVFCLGLILVVISGAELFTGNNLIAIAWASRKVSTIALLRNWIIVYLGNFLGSVATALIIFWGKQYTFGAGSVGISALNIANTKVGYEFFQAIALGVICNALVCLAVWMCFSARSAMDKIAVILFPITAFVAGGFEHSVANMYFIPLGLFIKQFDPTFAANSGLDLANLTWKTFFINNLIPVTIGNIIGGVFLVGIVYWVVFLRGSES